MSDKASISGGGYWYCSYRFWSRRWLRLLRDYCWVIDVSPWSTSSFTSSNLVRSQPLISDSSKSFEISNYLGVGVDG